MSTDVLAAEWDDVRRFGARLESQTYVPRPSAYGFVVDERNRVAVVRSADGCFLPGGGIEAGETPEEAVVREGLEECGWQLRVGHCVMRAVEFSYSTSDRAWYEKRCWFFTTQIAAVRAGEQLPGHEVLWLDGLQAIEALAHDSQRWAVRCAALAPMV
jgi:8-oxo-dGTP diphosphatase